jgi:hypothetical protein
MCFGMQFSPKKFTSCALLDIHKSKLVIVETHLSKIGKTYVCFVFSAKFGNTSLLKVFLDGKTTQGHNCIAKHFSKILSIN